ncbi:hypothetical protein [Hankyongella ginsenosidimutans]|uniref:hypothetical protein n=1 Tax=Hankyongella ginsenosidimutans TaxID=1763828 RepID=UPI001FEB59F7|nr:hypothetical protein [Hankyongella ginsenosidimutans]
MCGTCGCSDPANEVSMLDPDTGVKTLLRAATIIIMSTRTTMATTIMSTHTTMATTIMSTIIMTMATATIIMAWSA